MTRKEFVTKAVENLSGTYSPGESKAIAIRILTHFLHLSEYEYSVEPSAVIPRSELSPLQKALEELEAERPVQYVIGHEDFAGHRFHVSEAVLIPRPETEELCRMIIQEWKDAGNMDLKILDACTGSGCIACTLAAAFPKAEVLAFDIDEAALRIAEGQKVFMDEACRQPIKNPPVFFRQDLLSDPPEDIGDMDILVSNPPYVCESEKDFMRNNVLEYEPDIALFVPDHDPLRFYRALSEWALSLLKTGGRGYMEINETRGEEVSELFEEKGFSDVEIVQDIHGRDRFVKYTKWF